MIAIGLMELSERITFTLLCCGPLIALVLIIPFFRKKLENPWVHTILGIYVLVLGYYGRQLIKKQDEEEREKRLRRHMRQVELLQEQAESRQARIE